MGWGWLLCRYIFINIYSPLYTPHSTFFIHVCLLEGCKTLALCYLNDILYAIYTQPLQWNEYVIWLFACTEPSLFLRGNAIGNIVCKMVAVLFIHQYLNQTTLARICILLLEAGFWKTGLTSNTHTHARAHTNTLIGVIRYYTLTTLIWNSFFMAYTRKDYHKRKYRKTS